MIIYNIKNYNKLKNGPVTCLIGDFDGVHLGHKFLIENCKKIANNNNQSLIIITFYKNTKSIIKEIENNMIINNDDKNALLKQFGVDGVLYIDFNDIKNYSHDQFVDDILIKKIGCNNICVGNDFRFGKNKSGGIKDLQGIDNLNVHIIEKIKNENNVEFSSSVARDLIKNGNVATVKEVLGYDYVINGVVSEGLKLGRTIDFPTANIEFNNYIFPKFGVYAVNVFVNNCEYIGAANFGVKPTIGAKKPCLEVYIIDFSGDIYNQKIKVVFKEKIRDEIKFSGINELKNQIIQDVEEVNEFFNK